MGNSVQSEPVIRFQDFQVNFETGEVWKNGIRLKLQDQPFKVLVTLLQRPGQVIPREELHQLIWPQESFGDFDHAINLAVNKLRAALGDSADVPHLIETLPRRGYRFIAPVETLPTPKRLVPPAIARFFPAGCFTPSVPFASTLGPLSLSPPCSCSAPSLDFVQNVLLPSVRHRRSQERSSS